MGLLAGLEELHYYGISFLNKRVIFFVLITFITIFFSVIAFEPAEVVIIGPKFHEQESVSYTHLTLPTTFGV